MRKSHRIIETVQNCSFLFVWTKGKVYAMNIFVVYFDLFCFRLEWRAAMGWMSHTFSFSIAVRNQCSMKKANQKATTTTPFNANFDLLSFGEAKLLTFRFRSSISLLNVFVHLLANFVMSTWNRFEWFHTFSSFRAYLLPILHFLFLSLRLCIDCFSIITAYIGSLDTHTHLKDWTEYLEQKILLL